MFKLMLSVFVIVLVSHAVEARAQAPNVVTRESTVTATVDRIERSSRLVTLVAPGNQTQTVYVDPSVTAFDDLQKGDVVTIRYVESVVVQVRPDAAMSDVRDSTEEARQAGQENVVQQQKAVVTVESVDPQGLSIVYRMKNGLKAVRNVTDKRLVEGLRPGDRIEVTMTRQRAVSIDRVRR